MTKEELEKEAGEYADKHAFRVPYDGSNKFYDDVDFKASKDGYLAGAEPREKRIEELEATNKKISDECHKLVVSLEKKQNENAELKNRDCWKSCEYASPKAELIGQHIKDVQNLTKAKEIISEYVYILKGDTKNWKKTQEKAEQFLKDLGNE